MMRPNNPTPRYGLAFETSGAIGDVALGKDADILESRRLSGPLQHAIEFVPVMAAISEKHRVTPAAIRDIYVSCGPGSFTGLRLGITVARLLSMAVDARIVAVPSLDVIAQNALDLPAPPDRIVVVLDAKRRHVFAAVFSRQGDSYQRLTEPTEVEPYDFLTRRMAEHSCCGVLGEGVEPHRSAVVAAGAEILPDALHAARAETVYRLGRDMASRGLFTPRRDLLPTYVRLPEAEEKWLRRHASLGVPEHRTAER